jgi:putative membrane protein
MPTALAAVIRVVVVAASLWVAEWLVAGIDVDGATTGATIGTLLGVSVIFGLVNLVIKPAVKLLTGCLYFLTLGLFGLVVNALLLLLVGWIAGQVGLPFAVDGFWAAFLGAIVIGVVSFLLHVVIPDRYDQR